jgi:multidrug resistance efflux pump
MKTSPAQSSPSLIPSLQAQLDGQVVEVTAKAPGLIERMAVTAGQLVVQGDLLAEFDHRQIDRRLAAITALLDQAVLAATGGGKPRGLSEAELQRRTVHSRVELPSLPRGLRAGYLQARLERSNAEVRATISGRVIGVRVKPGERAVLAQKLFTILDQDDLWVVASFARSEFPRLRDGQRAKVFAAGHTFDARVTGLVGPETLVQFEFVEPRPSSLLPGDSARVLVEEE